jgi:hypothetical protein
MRLSRDLIQHIAETIAANVEAKGMAKLLVPRHNLAAAVAEVITGDMLAEDRLNEEVKKILASYESEISAGRMDYRKVFELTKQKLARERGMVL